MWNNPSQCRFRFRGQFRQLWQTGCVLAVGLALVAGAGRTTPVLALPIVPPAGPDAAAEPSVSPGGLVAKIGDVEIRVKSATYSYLEVKPKPTPKRDAKARDESKPSEEPAAGDKSNPEQKATEDSKPNAAAPTPGKADDDKNMDLIDKPNKPDKTDKSDKSDRMDKSDKPDKPADKSSDQLVDGGPTPAKAESNPSGNPGGTPDAPSGTGPAAATAPAGPAAGDTQVTDTKLVTVTLEIVNTGKAEATYQTYNGSLNGKNDRATMVLAGTKQTAPLADFGPLEAAGVTRQATLKPGESITDVLPFVPPPKIVTDEARGNFGPAHLSLLLPTKNVGGPPNRSVTLTVTIQVGG